MHENESNVLDKRHDQHPHLGRKHISKIWRGWCGFKTECNVHHCPHHLPTGCAQDSTLTRIVLRVGPPEVELDSCPSGCIWDCSHRTWNFGESCVVFEWTSEQLDDVVGCPDLGDVWDWISKLVFFHFGRPNSKLCTFHWIYVVFANTGQCHWVSIDFYVSDVFWLGFKGFLRVG